MTEPTPLTDIPERVIVDQHGHYWLDYVTHLSMPPVSDENVETVVAARYIVVDENLEWLVDQAVRAGIITASRAAELLGVSLREWRERANLLSSREKTYGSVRVPETALRAVAEEARLVSQWCDSIGSGPIEVLNEELRSLGEHALRALAQTEEKA